MFENKYSSKITLDEAIKLAVESIYLVSEEKVGSEHVKIATVKNETKTMRQLSDEEVRAYTKN